LDIIMLRKILIAFGVLAIAVAGLLLYASITQPDTFRVQRAMTINAPQEKVYGILTDLRRGAEWSPFEKDKTMKKTFSGPATGPGSALEWEGDSESGAGKLTITQATPSKIMLDLDMTQPMKASNVIEYDLSPKGNATNVTWSMHGPMNIVSKVMCTFMSMDKMLGGEFEKGLSNLNALAAK
jgi:uncharacterized protein YndB with AHSA1/START domain